MTDEHESAVYLAAAKFRDSREKLKGRVQRLQQRIAALQHQARGEIAALAAANAEDRAALVAAIEAAPHEFEKPRTRRIAGVKCGFRKLAGKVTFTDEARVIARIREQLPPDQVELLVRVRESVDKNAVADLTGDDARRLGINFTDAIDVVVVDAGDKELDKFLDALTRESQAPEAA